MKPRALPLSLWLATLLAACGRPDEAAIVRVAAASDLRFALDGVTAAFAEARPDLTVEVAYGSSGQFYAQLHEGAPFDLFLSADADYPRRLAADGLVLEGSAFPYSRGRLALWVPAESPLEIEARGLEALRDPAARRIALANPRHAPYGRAAREALERAGLAESLSDRVVLGENVAQAAQLVETGAADAGIIALSLALAPTMAASGRFVELPEELVPALEQGGCVLANSAHAEGALALRAFLLSPRGRELLAAWGFVLPTRPEVR